MDAIEPNWQALLVFLAASGAASVTFYFLSGTLPVSAAPRGLQSRLGVALVWGNVAMFVVLAALTIWFAAVELRWTSLIVGGGFMVLFAPFFVQDLPRALKDTKAGLACLLIVNLAAAALVWVAAEAAFGS